MPDENGKALEHELRVNQLYLAIISRYKEYIEEHEHMSVAELPMLVMPKNELVVKKAEEIKAMFGMYNYTSHFYEASIDAFHSIRNEIQDVSMPLEFWLTPDETLGFGIGDLIDKNVLLCSVLIALGNPSAKVLVSITGGNRRVLSYYEFEGKAYILDFALGFKKYENRDSLIKSLGIGEETICYEFNDQMYIDIA